MTKPALLAKSTLLRGCASAALLGAMVAVPQQGQAQAFNATPTVVQGTVNIDRSVPNVDTIRVDGNDAVIDWRPFGEGDTVMTFLPEGNTATFLGGNSDATFAVLNRILDLGAGDPAIFEGLVQAFLTDIEGTPTVPGGFVAFSSPTGIIVGATGRFEVPQLMLTSHDVNLATFAGFSSGGSMQLSGSTGSVDILSGATLTGTPEDSFLIVTAPDITMAGDAYYNGSIAYVAATGISLSHDSGLFDIFVQSGALQGEVITHTGSSGGPSSTGAGDEHVIYGVTAAAFGGAPVSMLFQGNLGFDPAASADVVNGDIILSANYNVFGRTVDGEDNRQGADSFFDGRSSGIDTRADIFLSGLTATSGLLAIGTHQTLLDAFASSSSFSGDLSLVGREQAQVFAALENSVIVGGDLFVSARNFGDFGQLPGDADATGGTAWVIAGFGGLVQVDGRTTVAASALPGIEFSNFVTVGAGTAGQARIIAEGGTIDLAGAVLLESYARTDVLGSIEFDVSRPMTGGTAELSSAFDGIINVGASVTADVTATTPDLSGLAPIAGADAIGGTVFIGHGEGEGEGNLGGTIDIATFIEATADAFAGSSTAAAGTGGSGQGGNIEIRALNGTLTIGDDVTLTADGFGGGMAGGTGGSGLGGTTVLDANAGQLSIGGSLGASASGQGGVSDIGGFAAGGSALIIGGNGAITIGRTAALTADAAGGNGAAGSGGNASGGNAAIQLADAATMTVGGTTGLSVAATGGEGNGGAGGAAVAGTASVLITGASSLDIAGALQLAGGAIGGTGIGGPGGDATGGSLSVQAFEGSLIVTTGALAQNAQGTGGTGTTGGAGAGGEAGVTVGANSLVDSNGITLGADGAGGVGTAGDGGAGMGGAASLLVASGQANSGDDLTFSALGNGGDSTGGAGGAGTGGIVELQVSSGFLDAAGGAFSGIAHGVGGDALSAGQQAGDGAGGNATLTLQESGGANLTSFVLGSNGIGGTGSNAIGGNGTGGFAGTLVAGVESVLATTGDSSVSALATGGDSTAAGSTGGSATGGSTVILAEDGAFLQSTGSLTSESGASGGEGIAQGGTAAGGTAEIGAQTGGEVIASQFAISAQALGGGGINGGAAAGGTAAMFADAGAVSATDGGIAMLANATGGSATTGTAGDAEGGIASAEVLAGGTIDASGPVALNADAIGGITSAAGNGGIATGGTSGLQITGPGSDFTTSGSLAITAGATGGHGASAQGGDASLTVANAGAIQVGADTSVIATAEGLDGLAEGADAGSTVGGSAAIFASDASVTFGGIVALDASALSGSGATGGASTGGSALFSANASTIDAVGDISLSANAVGGAADASGTGGTAQGGDAVVDFVAGSTLTGGASLAMSATATGGDGGDGLGGTAIGGAALLQLSGGSAMELASNVGQDVQALGGAAPGGSGGDATGGNADISISGTSSSLTIGGSLAQLGSAQSLDGGNAGGGAVTLELAEGAMLQVSGSTDLIANGEAMGADAEGVGGAGNGGLGLIDIAGSSAAFVGDLAISVLGSGGSAADAGAGTGGQGVLHLVGSTATLGAGLAIDASGVGGTDPTGSGSGGNGSGGAAVLAVTDSAFDAGNGTSTLSAEGLGAGSANGTGGDGVGGSTTADIANSTADLGAQFGQFAGAVSGGSTGGTSGTASGGQNLFAATGSAIAVGGLTMESDAFANGPAAGGDATGGDQTVELTDTLLEGASLFVSSRAESEAEGANVTGGDISVTLAGGSNASFAGTYAESSGVSTNNAALSQTGTITFATLSGGAASTLALGETEIVSQASGGATNTGGATIVSATNGTVVAPSLSVTALGDIGTGATTLAADNGIILIADALAIDVPGDVSFEYANGGAILGGAAPGNLSATFDVTADGTIAFAGDDASEPRVGALEMTLASSDIEVGELANFGAASLTLQSLNLTDPAVLGGTSDEAGYTLTNDEAANITAQALTILMPDVSEAQFDVEIRAFTSRGSLAGGLSSVTLETPGSIEVVGQVLHQFGGPEDLLTVIAGGTLQFTLPGGGLRMEDDAGNLSGAFAVFAGSVIAADASLAAQIAADPDDPAIADALLDDGGATSSSSYIAADRVEIFADTLVYTQNTGADGVYGGITVGAGGLVIASLSEGESDPLRVIAFGLQDSGETQLTGDDFFFEVGFAEDREANYTTGSTFNNCIIVTSACPMDPEEPGEPGEPTPPSIDFINQVLVEQPVAPKQVAEDGNTLDFRFGFDFPSLMDAPLISEDGVIRDPVTSGGDSAVYATIFGSGVEVIDPEDEDCDDADENGRCEGDE